MPLHGHIWTPTRGSGPLQERMSPPAIFLAKHQIPTNANSYQWGGTMVSPFQSLVRRNPGKHCRPREVLLRGSGCPSRSTSCFCAWQAPFESQGIRSVASHSGKAFACLQVYIHRLYAQLGAIPSFESPSLVRPASPSLECHPLGRQALAHSTYLVGKYV